MGRNQPFEKSEPISEAPNKEKQANWGAKSNARCPIGALDACHGQPVKYMVEQRASPEPGERLRDAIR